MSGEGGESCLLTQGSLRFGPAPRTLLPCCGGRRAQASPSSQTAAGFAAAACVNHAPRARSQPSGVYLLRRDPGLRLGAPMGAMARLPGAVIDRDRRGRAARGVRAGRRRAGGDHVPRGVGRTGTALSATAILVGVPATEAVAWVHQRVLCRPGWPDAATALADIGPVSGAGVSGRGLPRGRRRRGCSSLGGCQLGRGNPCALAEGRLDPLDAATLS